MKRRSQTIRAGLSTTSPEDRASALRISGCGADARCPRTWNGGEGGVGFRSSLRFEAYFGLFGFEVGHEWRDVPGGAIHGVRFPVTTDLFVPIQLVRFFTWLDSF
jgi:hypothetical protein